MSTLPYGDEVLIALRRVELDRPVKRRSGPTVGSAHYGERYIDPSAPKPD